MFVFFILSNKKEHCITLHVLSTVYSGRCLREWEIQFKREQNINVNYNGRHLNSLTYSRL